LELNETKSKFITSNPKWRLVDTIMGLERAVSYKYLGLEIWTDKIKIVGNVKRKIKGMAK